MAERLDLARDVLDELLVDTHNREFGRVDGILLHLRQGRPPRVAEMEVGTYTVLRRINRPFGEWLAGVLERLSPVSLESARLPFGTTPGALPDPAGVRTVAQSRQFQVGSVRRGQLSGKMQFPVRVPVVRRGATKQKPA